LTAAFSNTFASSPEAGCRAFGSFAKRIAVPLILISWSPQARAVMDQLRHAGRNRN
jgi:hypothetical protein